MKRLIFIAILLAQFFWFANNAIAEEPNDHSFESRLSLYSAVCNTSLVGRQAEMTDEHFILAKDDFHKLLLLAEPLSKTSLVGRQGQVFDRLVTASWNDQERLLKVSELLSHSKLIGRQNQVLERLEQLEAGKTGQ
jgi:hypothetical protein